MSVTALLDCFVFPFYKKYLVLKVSNNLKFVNLTSFMFLSNGKSFTVSNKYKTKTGLRFEYQNK